MSTTKALTSLVPATPNAGLAPISTTTIQALPQELLIHIFSGLNAQALCACSLVCKEWRELSQDNILWRGLFTSMFPTCNPSGIENFQKAYQEQLPYLNFAKGVYASHTLTGHTRVVSCLAVIDGMLVSGSSTIRSRLGFKDSAMLHTLRGHNWAGYLPSSCRWVARFRLFGQHDQVWDLKTSQCLHTLTGHTNGVSCLAVIDGMLVSGSWDNTIKVWDLKTNQCLHTLMGHTRVVSCLAVIDGMLVSGSDDHTIRVWI